MSGLLQDDDDDGDPSKWIENVTTIIKNKSIGIF